MANWYGTQVQTQVEGRGSGGTRQSVCRTRWRLLLDVDKAVEKAKFDEARSVNAGLLKERDDIKQRFEGIDPEEVRKLAVEKRQLEEAQQLTAGEVDKVVENRIKGLRADWAKQLGAVTAERDSLNGRLTGIQIDQGVTPAASKRGWRPTPLQHPVQAGSPRSPGATAPPAKASSQAFPDGLGWSQTPNPPPRLHSDRPLQASFPS